jgi:hypothetical protein
MTLPDDREERAMADDPRWAWLEQRLLEIHHDVKAINGTVRRHDVAVAKLESLAHRQESCNLVAQVRKDVDGLLMERRLDQQMRAVLVGVATVIGGIIVLVAQMLAQKWWH